VTFTASKELASVSASSMVKKKIAYNNNEYSIDKSSEEI